MLPVIGDYLIKEHLRKETLATFGRVECHAQSLAEMDMQVPLFEVDARNREDIKQMLVALLASLDPSLKR